MAERNVQSIYTDHELAKTAAKELEARFGKKRFVYKYVDPNSGEVTFIVAQNLQRARSHVAAWIKLPVELAEPGVRGFQRPRTAEEIISAASEEQLAQLREMLGVKVGRKKAEPSAA